MSAERTVDDRLTELEVKATYTEDLVDHLNALVAKQQETIEFLLREVVRLREQAGAGDGGAERTLREEVPPHY